MIQIACIALSNLFKILKKGDPFSLNVSSVIGGVDIYFTLQKRQQVWWGLHNVRLSVHNQWKINGGHIVCAAVALIVFLNINPHWLNLKISIPYFRIYRGYLVCLMWNPTIIFHSTYLKLCNVIANLLYNYFHLTIRTGVMRLSQYNDTLSPWTVWPFDR